MTYQQAIRRDKIAFVLGIALIVAACATTAPPDVKKYQSIQTCNVAEQSLIRAFGVVYQSNKAKDPALWADRYNKAIAAHAAYEKIRDAAVDAAKTGGETTLILATINEALNQVSILLASYGVK
jgi:hypothetical protein